MFEEDLSKRLLSWKSNRELLESSRKFTRTSLSAGYTYNFQWLGKKFIQMPEDILNLHRIIFNTMPSVIVETGVAHGGSSLFYCSMLHLAHLYNRSSAEFKYLGLDISLRNDTIDHLSTSAFGSNILLYECDTSSPNVLDLVRPNITANDRVMVVLDSCHTTEHVAAEISLLGSLVSHGCYLVVCDTTVGILGPAHKNCRYGVNKDNSPYQALRAIPDTFVPDTTLHMSQLASCNLGGYYIRV